MATPSTPTKLFPFNGSAWKKLYFEADVTDSDSTNLTFYVDYSTTSSTLASGVTTLSAPVTLPSVGATARASLTSASTVTENTVYYWRAYVKDEINNQSSYSPIFSFTIKLNAGDNMVPDGTPFMQQADPNYHVRVIDVSQFQEDDANTQEVDWTAVKNDGINYAYLRCWASTGADTKFTKYVTRANAVGIKTGGYIYGMPPNPPTLASARSQADSFIAQLQVGYGTGNYGDLIPILDIEDNSSKVSSPNRTIDMPVEDMLLWCNEFRNYFESQTGRTLGLYTGEYFVRDQRNNFNHDYSTGQAVAGTSGNLLKDMPLWIQGYTQYPRYMGGVMPSVGGWTKWHMFQWSDTQTQVGITYNKTDQDWAEPMEYMMPPKATTGLSATDNGSNMTLTWSPTTEQDVNKWDIYINGVKNTTVTTDGTATITGLSPNTNYTIEVRPIDDFGDDPIVAPTTTTHTIVPSSAPLVSIVNVSRLKISDVVGVDRAVVRFTFDADAQSFTVNVNGVDYSTGTVAHTGGGQTVSELSTDTVGNLATKTVQQISIILAGTELVAEIDWSEVSLGSNRVNIYGKGTGGLWTPYDS